MSNVVGTAQVDIEPGSTDRFRALLTREVGHGTDKVNTSIEDIAKNLGKATTAASKFQAEVGKNIKIDSTALTAAIEKAAANVKVKLSGNNIKIDLAISSAELTKAVQDAAANARLRITGLKITVDGPSLREAIEAASQNASVRVKNIKVDLDKKAIADAIEAAADSTRVRLYAKNFDIKAPKVDVPVSADTGSLDRAQAKMRETEDVAERTSHNIGSRFGTMFAGLGTAGVIAFSRIAIEAGKFGIETAKTLETSQVSFEGLLGSQEKAAALMQNLKDFALKTPFELPGLTESAKRLLGVGFSADQIIPNLTKLGNVAAALGASEDDINGVVRAIGQMKGKGKASAEELQQISENLPGFSAINVIAQDMGISVADAFTKMEAGAIPADKAIAALLSGMEKFPGAAGAMERQSQTLAGQLSNLKDIAGQGLAQAILPLTTAFKDLIPPLTFVLAALFQSLGEALVPIGTAFSSVFTALAPVLGTFVVQVGNIVGAIGAGLTPILQALAPHLTAFLRLLGENAVTLITALAPALAKIVEAASPLLPLFGSLITDAVGAIVPVLAELVGAVAPVISAFVQGLEPALQALEPVWPILSGALVDVAKAFTPILTALSPLLPAFAKFEATLASKVIPAVVVPVLEALAQVLTILSPVIEDLARTIGDQLQPILDALEPVWPEMQTAITELLKAFVELVPVIVPVVTALVPLIALVAKFAAAFEAKYLTLVTIPALKVLTFLLQQLKPVVEFVAAGWEALIKSIASGDFSHLGDWIGGVLTDLQTGWERIQSWVSGTAIPWLQEQAPKWWDAFVGWVTEAAPKMLASLGTWLAAFGVWFTTTALPWLQEKAGQMGSAFLSWVSDQAAQMPERLGEWATAFGSWVLETGIPWLLEKGAELGVAFLRWVGDQALALPEKLGAVISTIGGWITGTAIPWLIEHGGELASSFLSWLGGVLLELPGKLAEIAGFVLGWITRQAIELPGRIDTLREKFLTWLANVIKEAPGKLAEFATTVWGWITDFVASLPDRISQIKDAFLDWLKQAAVEVTPKLVEFADNVKKWLQELPGKILEWLGDTGKWLWDAGKNALEGLWNGMKDAVPAIIEKVKDIPGQFIDAFKEGFGISSPATEMIPVGAFAMAGLDKGIWDQVPTSMLNAAAAVAQVVAAAQAAVPSPIVMPEIFEGGRVKQDEDGGYWVEKFDANGHAYNDVAASVRLNAPAGRLSLTGMARARQMGIPVGQSSGFDPSSGPARPLGVQWDSYHPSTSAAAARAISAFFSHPYGGWGQAGDTITSPTGQRIGPNPQFWPQQLLDYIGIANSKGKTVDKSEIGRFAYGGLVTRPMVGLLGENAATRPEIVSPVGTLQQIIAENLRRYQSAGVTIGQLVVNTGGDEGTGAEEKGKAAGRATVSTIRNLVRTAG